MSVKHLQLKGNNLNNIECVDRGSIIHPETCVNDVLINDSNNQTLKDWLLYDHHTEQPFEGGDIKTGLLEWLETYYPNEGYTLPTAKTDSLGGIKVGNGLSVDDNDGTLSIDVSIPSINKASYGDNTVSTDYTANGYGTIKLGNDAVIDTDFSNGGSFSYENSYKFPLRLDNKGRAGIEIDASLFGSGLEQSNWNQTDNTKSDYIKNKPTLATVATSGSYNDLTDKPSIGQVNDGILTIKYGDTTLDTFSANTDDNTTITIPVGLNYLPVETLPIENISTTTIYLLPKTSPETGDYYEEWMYINRGTVEIPNYNWERIGNTLASSSYTGSSPIAVSNSNVISYEDLQTVSTSIAPSGTTTDITINNNKKYIYTITANGNIDFYIMNEDGVETTIILIGGGSGIDRGVKLNFYKVGPTEPTGFITHAVINSNIGGAISMDIETNPANKPYWYTWDTPAYYDTILINIRQRVAYIYVKGYSA